MSAQVGSPLLASSSGAKKSKQDQGCFSRNRKKISIVAFVTVVILIIIAITLVLTILKPAYTSQPVETSNAKTKSSPTKTKAKSLPKTPKAGSGDGEIIDDSEPGDIIIDEEIDTGPNPALAFVGSWKLESQEKFEDFLKALGIGVFQRMIAASAVPEMDISLDGDVMTIVNRGLRTNTVTINFGEEIEEKTLDGRNVLTIHTWEGSKWMQKERWDIGWDDKEALYVREIIDDVFVTTITMGEVVCIRRFKRI